MTDQNAPALGNTTSRQIADYLLAEHEQWETLFNAQPRVIQQFLQAQARQITPALLQGASQIRFTLPDRVVVEADGSELTVAIPAESREQAAGGLLDRLARTDIRLVLRQRLAELESSSEKGVVVSAGLMRHTTAVYLVDMLPTGRSVTYVAVEGEELPTIPLGDELEPESAITESTDAIAEEDNSTDSGRGALHVPYVPSARRFYLPQWVAFDSNGRLLVNSLAEAEAILQSMQKFMASLHTAVALEPSIIAHPGYQHKRAGMLGQLVNQGRALALYETQEIIQTIQRRAKAHDLNRGLSLSLPYFDDQTLEMKVYNFEVIPPGRIMFVPAFAVRAANLEQGKIAQDTRLSVSTRKYLLAELQLLADAFVAGESTTP